VPLVPGDAFLLCSDGVWEYLRDEEILIDLLKARNARKWAELLLLRLMNRISGENDNLTLLALILK
jgi:serine/threonine protein phosphatase PrpC